MTDRELTQLQEEGEVALKNPAPLAEIVSGLDTLGIDPSKVYIYSAAAYVLVSIGARR